MSKIHFRPNATMRIGVEIELQLVDPVTGDLKPSGQRILESLPQGEKSRHIKSEIFQSMLEIDTPICATAFEVGTSLRHSLGMLRKAAAAEGTKILMAGTHPFAQYTERLLTPHSRYFDLVDRNQWITRRLQIFGLHVHLGMRDGEHAIAMNNAICHYLPVILALSASSPYWQREDTGLASSRITFFEAIPTGGHPYILRDWTEFESLVEVLIRSRSIQAIKDLWWDIRPNTEYGTVEIRIADCPPTIREVEALVALIHAIAASIDHDLAQGRTFAPPPEWILRENKWRASRHGVQCDLVRDTSGVSVPFAQIWQELWDSMKGTVESKGYTEFFQFLDTVVSRGPSYLRQRAQFQKEDPSLISVVRHLIRENELDQPQW